MNMSKNAIIKTLAGLGLATGIIGLLLVLPHSGSLFASSEADIAADISGPSSVSGTSGSASATYSGTITWTGTVPPSLLGNTKYVYEFVAESPSGQTQSSGRTDTFTASSPRSFTHSFNLNETGNWQVCFNAWLVFNGGTVAKTDCATTSANLGGGDGDPNPQPGNVSVTISANPQTIFRGETSRLTWVSTNATSCTASGGWTGGKNLDGSQNVTPTVTTTYTITCSNSADTASDAVTVIVKEQEQPKQEICGNGVDDDGDGQVDENCVEICGDGRDNDGDGQIDEGCQQPPEVCGDGIDNDGDGRIDENCPAPTPQPTVDITANPQTIVRGQSSTLSWTSQNATSCVASNGWSGSKPLSGTQSVSPTSDTTYRITCSNSAGSASDSVTVRVTAPQPNLPTVDIDANPRTIVRGQSSTLSWTSQNATSCVASQGWSGSKPLSGTQSVSPTSDTTYRITCSNSAGSAVDSVTVFVNDPQQPTLPTVDISANPQTIERGESSTLSWTSQNATSCVASQGWSGSKNLSGSQVVSPTTDTTYRITCSNSVGSAVDSVTVFVTSPPQPNLPTVDITANPQHIDRGETSKLAWVSQNATTCNASVGWSGSKSLNGQQNVTPLVDTTYRITCSNSAGSATDSVTVFVSEQPEPPTGDVPSVDIDASPRTIEIGDSSILFWNSDNADTCVASGGWSGNVSLDGSRTVSPVRNTTYTITCSNERGSDVDSVTIVVVDEEGRPADGNITINVNVNNTNNNTNTSENNNDNSNRVDIETPTSTYQPPIITPPIYYPPTTYQPPVYQPPTYYPPASKPPVYYPPTVKPAVQKSCTECVCPCDGNGQGIVINNSNTVNLVCEDGVCRPVANGQSLGSYSTSNSDRDNDDGSGFLASVSGSGIAKLLGYIFLFFVGLLLLGILVYIIMELMRAITSRNGHRHVYEA